MVGGKPIWLSMKSGMQVKRCADLNMSGSYWRSHISLLTVYMGCRGMPVI